MSEGWNKSFIENTKGLPKFGWALEIGCYEGKTSKYICENLLTAQGFLICVDPLQDTYLVDNLNEISDELNKEYGFFKGQYDRFRENTEGLNLFLLRTTFKEGLKALNQIKYDFIYVDGDHREEAVYYDAVKSFEILKTGGYILFDDYLWERTNVKKSVDKFLEKYKTQLKVIIKNYQVLIQKI